MPHTPLILRRAVPVLVLLALAACDEGERAEAPDPPPRPIAWDRAEEAALETRRTLTGHARAIQRAPLSFEVGGRVRSISVKAGERFAEGDVLATLDPTPFELERAQRASDVAEAEATLQEARREFERVRTLLERRVVSEARFDDAEQAFESARNRLESARAGLALAEENLADTVILAPYDGTVAVRHAEPAQQAAAGQAVLDVQGQAGGYEAVISVPEMIAGQVDLGSRHIVRAVAAWADPMMGEVREVSSQASDTGAFPVTLLLHGTPADLRVGMTVEVELRLADPGAETGVSIPLTAFALHEDGAHVFIFDEEAQVVRRRDVTLGEIEGDRAVVRAGLSPGEIVATRGAHMLRDGQATRLLGVGPASYDPQLAGWSGGR